MTISSQTAPIVGMFPCRSDNYGYLLHDFASKETICIDTPDADTILKFAEQKHWHITQIWNTHWHDDHAGGNAAIQQATGCKIYAPHEVKERLNAPVDTFVSDGDQLKFGDHVAQVIATPGHTLQHVCYYLPTISSAFVGDTLFSLGCGRMFEGKPDMFWYSLQKLRDLPNDTHIYCAHEYTLSNLEFVESLPAMTDKVAQIAKTIRAQREENRPTVPTFLGDQIQANPFLCADDPVLQTSLATQNDANATFAKLRAMKDKF